ncbi:adenylate/guanylate cyclase domain-containing protein [Thermodesulfobacteriota bacterium]
MTIKDKNIAGTNFAPIFSYLDKLGKDASIIFERTGLSREYLTDRREYIDLPTALIIFNAVKDIIAEKDPMIFYEIGKEAARERSLEVLQDIGAFLGNVQEMVRFIPRFNRKYNNIFDMVVCAVSDNSAVVLIYYKSKYDGLWIYDQCAWNKGNIAAIPTVCDLPYMVIEEPLCRFSLEEIFRDYAFMNHNYQYKDSRAFLDGEAFAARVLIGKEELEKSFDKLSRINPFTNKGATTSVLTNERYEIAEHDDIERLQDVPTGMLIIKDTKVSNRLTLRKGQIFGASCCRLNIRWEGKKQVFKALVNKTLGRHRSSSRLLKHLEKELEVNISQKQELIKSKEELQIAHYKLKEYTERLEHMVQERTQELEAEKEKVLNAQKLLSRYMAPQLSKKILEGQIEVVWGHYRKKLTMFFSDIKDFTKTTDAMEPEDMANLLNEYLSYMIDIVHQYEGTLAHIIGDALFVFFGAPEGTNDKDHALKCTKMAINMQLKMKELQEKWFQEGVEDPLKIRCGINTGMATVGGYGSEDRREYTAMGMQVNLTSRLESACIPSGILMSHSTWALVKDDIKCKEMGKITVKGFHRPVRTYSVVFDKILAYQ